MARAHFLFTQHARLACPSLDDVYSFFKKKPNEFQLEKRGILKACNLLLLIFQELNQAS